MDAGLAAGTRRQDAVTTSALARLPAGQQKPGFQCCPEGSTPDAGGQCKAWCPNGAMDSASQKACGLGFDQITFDPADPSKLRCIGGAIPDWSQGTLACVKSSPLFSGPVCPAGWSKQNIPSVGLVRADRRQQFLCGPDQQVSSIDNQCHNLCSNGGVAWPVTQCCAPNSVVSATGKCCPPNPTPGSHRLERANHLRTGRTRWRRPAGKVVAGGGGGPGEQAARGTRQWHTASRRRTAREDTPPGIQLRAGTPTGASGREESGQTPGIRQCPADRLASQMAAVAAAQFTTIRAARRHVFGRRELARPLLSDGYNSCRTARAVSRAS